MPDFDFTIRQGDTLAAITATLTNSAGAATDISGATVVFTMSLVSGAAAKVNAAASNIQVGDGSDGSKGKVSYAWRTGDTDTPGFYLASWIVTFTDGSIQTYPNGGYTLVYVSPEAPAAVGANYITLEELKGSQSLSGYDYADDDLNRAIAAACRAIDEVTGRRFYPDADANQVRKFWPVNSGYAVIDDLCEFTSLVAQDSTWTLDTDFYLEPINAAPDGRPWTAIRTIARPFIYTLADRAPSWAGFDGRITVTGKWGWASTPAQITEASGILAARLVRRAREAPFAVIGTGIDNAAVRIGRTDPDVAMLIEPFIQAFVV